MARGRKFLAAGVHDTAMILSRNPYPPPNRFKAIASIAPAEVLTRPYPIQHSNNPKSSKKPKNLFRPTKIVYPEDRLRTEFYMDHPWELARPRMLLELDGQDARWRRWGRGLMQPGMKLSGENVVQRQLWLMQVKKMSKRAAYDKARKEFYDLRQTEEIENRIAIEEARMVGAYFGKTDLQVGMEMEAQTYNAWKKWASGQIAAIDSERNAAYANLLDDTEESEEVGVVP
ncbi:putative 37S ribosomal protein [Podospora fimiseda]|uniref:37S ribosomal protein S25, mitochondrial n=1 Tax=Podospora fimiseda TaxID=252190 RepID=A0AAN7BT08_9PEZI|nr:putative 37S ribosomal protein [Podospora fimiseda]